MEGMLTVQNFTLCLQSISNTVSRFTLASRLPNLRLSQTKTVGPQSLREELIGMIIQFQPKNLSEHSVSSTPASPGSLVLLAVHMMHIS